MLHGFESHVRFVTNVTNGYGHFIVWFILVLQVLIEPRIHHCLLWFLVMVGLVPPGFTISDFFPLGTKTEGSIFVLSLLS